MEGYVTTYSNRSSSGHKKVKDRVYNWGTVTNTLWVPPHTGDGPWVYVFGALALLTGTGLLVTARRKRRRALRK